MFSQQAQENPQDFFVRYYQALGGNISNTPPKYKGRGRKKQFQKPILKQLAGDFPGGQVVKTWPSNAGGAGSIPGRGAKIPTCLEAKKPKHKTEAIL